MFLNLHLIVGLCLIKITFDESNGKGLRFVVGGGKAVVQSQYRRSPAYIMGEFRKHALK